MSWLFENFTKGVNFSDLVKEAKTRGYTEPDPREDLSCQDLVRKLLILAREIGLKLDWQDIQVQSLVPEHLRDISAAEFMDKVTDMDEPMNQMLEEAAKDAKVPRLLASFSVSQDNKVTASIGIEYIPEGDMLANLIPGENIFVIQTGIRKCH